jgi:hypothetical protein
MLNLIHRGPYESKPRQGWGCRHSGGTVFCHISRYQKASVYREPDRVFDGDGCCEPSILQANRKPTVGT